MEQCLEIKGIYSAMMTPYDGQGNISERKIIEFMEFFLQQQLDGVFPVSNVGEFALLDFEEKCRIIELCTKMGKGKMKVCPGAGDLNLDKTIDLAIFSKQCGADAVVLSAPYYYPYGEEYVESYIQDFLEVSPLPVIFYHSPRFTNPVRSKFLLELLNHPKVVALKESSGDIRFLLTLQEQMKQAEIKTQIMMGWEELLLTGLVNGASGCITSCAGIVPELLQQVHRCWQENDLNGAVAAQTSICRITQLLGRYGFPQGYKLGMAARIPHQILRANSMMESEAKLQEIVKEIRQNIQEELGLLVRQRNMI